ncbi:hypothetical protein WJX72_009134 [[Myrmecia] bisecta]|uniref:WW domain-containing protein n=1 Tax=[Myrmecia] bisecta TaxID=41462 RepID=A0AAW1QFW5_9CHLO
MDMHHKLRRDPNWHPSGCNICGQVGHQAANCTNGTINWKQIYGEESFVLRAPLYPSDYDRLAKAKQVDYKDLEKRAREYAKMRATAAGINYDDMTRRAQEMLTANEAAAGAKRPREGENGAAGAVEDSAAKTAPAAAKPEEPLPAGWAVAKDAQGRSYFWHTKTKKVQWERPTPETPIE